MDDLPVWMYQYFGLDTANSSHNKEKGRVRYCCQPIQLISDTHLNPLNTPAAQFSGLKYSYKLSTDPDSLRFLQQKLCTFTQL